MIEAGHRDTIRIPLNRQNGDPFSEKCCTKRVSGYAAGHG